MRSLALTLSLLNLVWGGQSMNTVTVAANQIMFSGRSREDPTQPGALQFDMPGSSFMFIVENTSQIVLDMSQVGEVGEGVGIYNNLETFWPSDAETNTNSNMANGDSFLWPNCFEVFIDDSFVTLSSEEYHSFCTTSWDQKGGSNLINITPTTLDETKSHVIQVFKSSEAQFNSIVVLPNYVTLNSINLYGDISPSFSVPEAPARRIEFLGDSITAGYCNLCQETSESNVFAESQYESWPNRVASQLNAEFHTVAWSGYGMVNNCCGGNTTMPMIYPRALATVNDAMWDFSTWIPDVVVINLGTNDISSGNYDEQVYAQTYGDLLQNMTQFYGDNVSFFLACGPMLKKYCDGVEDVITSYNSNPANTPTAYFLDQTSLDVVMNCCGHPTSADDVIMANFTASFISNIMGWS